MRARDSAYTQALREVIQEAMRSTAPGEAVVFPMPGVLNAAMRRMAAAHAESEQEAEPGKEVA